MNFIGRTCILVLAFSFLGGCASFTAAEESAVATEVIRVTRRFEQAERELDVEQVLATLDPGFYMYQDGKRVGYDAVVKQIRSTMPTLKRFDAKFSNLEVIVMGRDSASVSFVFHDAITDQSGSTTRQTGATTMLWRRRAEGWRIVYVDADHYPVGG